jgi:ACS family hexuronate transporter-like MFS transporter
LFQPFTGRLVDHFQKQHNATAGYAIVFSVCACMYLVAFALNHLCAPRFEPFQLKEQPR